jgi:uncharacterized protein YtpQ (UPF0354 family)
VQVTSTRFLPLLVSTADAQVDDDHLLDEFTEGIAIGYSFGPPYGERLVSWTDLDRLGSTRRSVRRIAMDNLDHALVRLRIHGQPPALMLSFDGLESSALLVDEFWDDLQRSVPGELIVGVPARDVVIVTGSESRPGLAKARRAVDRVFFAGDEHLLSRDLLVWRGGTWQPLCPPAPTPAPTGQPYRPPAQRRGQPERTRWSDR